jgi:hypothetical protein
MARSSKSKDIWFSTKKSRSVTGTGYKMDNKYIEQEHYEFLNSEDYKKMIKEKLEYSDYYKYQGIAPEGFTLIPNELLNDLKDLNNWLDFKENDDWIEKKWKKMI